MGTKHPPARCDGSESEMIRPDKSAPRGMGGRYDRGRLRERRPEFKFVHLHHPAFWNPGEERKGLARAVMERACAPASCDDRRLKNPSSGTAADGDGDVSKRRRLCSGSAIRLVGGTIDGLPADADSVGIAVPCRRVGCTACYRACFRGMRFGNEKICETTRTSYESGACSNCRHYSGRLCHRGFGRSNLFFQPRVWVRTPRCFLVENENVV